MVAAAAVGARGRAERRRRPARRRRLRAVRLLRLRHRHAHASTGSAASGQRYSNFHTTALCSPTRACLLTGRNHHSNGMARIVEFAAGFPGYNATIPQENGFLSEILRAQRLRHLRGGQVAPHAGDRDDDGQPARQVAARPGLRALLRVHGRRDRPVPPRSRLRQPPRRAAAHAGGGLPPHRGPGRPGDPVPQGPARDLRADKPFFLWFTPGRLPRAAPGAGRRTSSRYRGQLRPGLGRWRDEVFARQVASRPAADGHRAVGAARRGCRRGTR